MEVKTKGTKTDSLRNDKSNKGKGEEKLGGNITLSGFNLEPIEMVVIKKIIGTYAKKISEKTEYNEIKVTLKQTQKEKYFLHEIKVFAETKQGILTSSSENKSLYSALSEALDRVYSQAEHKDR